MEERRWGEEEGEKEKGEGRGRAKREGGSGELREGCAPDRRPERKPHHVVKS